jgi:hypothetical protein
MKDINSEKVITTGWPSKANLSTSRLDKPVKDWNTKDLAAHFAARAYEEGFAYPGSIPGDQVGRIINKLVSDGLTRYQIQQLMKRYFEHVRMWGRLMNSSLWANFMSYAYKFQNTVRKEPPPVEVEYLNETMLRKQAEFLAMLEEARCES